MDDKIDEHLPAVPAVAAFKALSEDAETTAAPDRYRSAALKLLYKLRTAEGLTDEPFVGVIRGSGAQGGPLAKMLTSHKLAGRDRRHTGVGIPNRRGNLR
jgi:hypothetical protein